MATRTYVADFYCFEEKGDRNSSSLREILESNIGGHAPAYSLDDKDTAVKHQIRSIRKNKNGNLFAGVFGKLRRDAVPEQATEDGQDSDVELLPGHGLVEKSHFLLYPDINLIVFQRNKYAGSKNHFQAYLNKPEYLGRVLVPVLTKDSYNKLMNGGPIKRLEISIRRPASAINNENAFLKDYINLFGDSNANLIRAVISARVGDTLLDSMKTAIVKLSKFDRVSVARATMADDDEVVDLILDRVVHKFEVELLPNGRPDVIKMFRGLDGAKHACAKSLEEFFRS